MTSELTPEEGAVWRDMMGMAFQLVGELGRSLARESAISYQDYLVLAVLREQPEGRARPADLGRELGWEKSRVSHHVSRMVARGLVKRQPFPTDRRGFVLVATAKGSTAADAAAPVHAEVVRRCFLDVVSDRELATIGRVSSRVRASLAAQAT